MILINELDRSHCSILVMEDTNAMTIEFLRARLLSERAVSRSSRQRADELATRVAELEEQLKIVSLQRKKAEKATEEVLAILEENGVNDNSDGIDSSSEQDSQWEPRGDSYDIEVERSSTNSTIRKNESEFSGSDHELSGSTGKSLSWKGRKKSPEKCKDSLLRRRSSSFAASIGFSSSKHRQGKSCRQIKRRESRSIGGNIRPDPLKADSEENGAAASSELCPKTKEHEPEEDRRGSVLREDGDLPENPQSSFFSNERNGTNNELVSNGYGIETDMEQALEHQAQLIGRYEGMERAQRDWEDKFRDNNNNTQDSFDPGNHSDVTEERDEVKAQAKPLSATVASQVKETNSKAIGTCFTKEPSNDFLPPLKGDRSLKAKESSTSDSESAVPDFTFPSKNKIQNQENSDEDHNRDPTQQCLCVHGDDQSALTLSSNSETSSCKGETFKDQQEAFNTLVPHETTTSSYVNVLETLKQAKLSLQHKMRGERAIESSMPSTKVHTGMCGERATESSIPATKAQTSTLSLEYGSSARKDSGIIDVPDGCAGLFRIPTELSIEKTNIFSSHRGLNANGRVFMGTYSDTRSSLPIDGQLIAGARLFVPYVDATPEELTNRVSSIVPTGYTGSGITTERPGFQRNSHLLSFSSYLNPAVVQHTAVSEGFSVIHPSLSAGVLQPSLSAGVMHPSLSAGLPPSLSAGLPPGDEFSFHDDYFIRRHMHR